MFCDREFSIERYVDYLLDVPMYFIIRNKYIDLTGHTFRDLMDGKIKKMDVTFSDWENHTTTIFTEVRLKIIEVRGADGGHGQEFVLCLRFGLEFYMMRKFLMKFG